MSAEVTDSEPRAEEAWTGPSWKAAARAYHSDRKRSRQTAPRERLLSVDYLLAELRCAVLRTRLIQADLISIGIALKQGMLSPEEALEELEAIDPVRLIQPTLPVVSS
jgi:hypothetical protein